MVQGSAIRSSSASGRISDNSVQERLEQQETLMGKVIRGGGELN